MTAPTDIVKWTAALDWIDTKQLVGLTGQAESDFDLVIVKELVDNAIDAAEKTKIPPTVGVVVQPQGDRWVVVVADCGPGIRRADLPRILDFEARASSKDWRRAPTRGQQGNALKTVAGIPAAQSRRRGPHARTLPAFDVMSVDGMFTVELDPSGGRLVAVVREKTDRTTGPLTLVNELRGAGGFSPTAAVGCVIDSARPDRISALLLGFTLVNPHLRLVLRIHPDEKPAVAARGGSASWRPSEKSSIHWYTASDFVKLCDAARQLGWTVAKMVGTLAGFSAKAEARDVMEEAGIAPGTRVADLDADAMVALALTLRDRAEEIGPQGLRTVGKRTLLGAFRGRYAAVAGSFTVGDATVPFIIEAALAAVPADLGCGNLFFGINYSPTFMPPLPTGVMTAGGEEGVTTSSGIVGLATRLCIDREGGADLHLHIVCPRLAFRDKGKAMIDAPPEMMAAMGAAVWAVAAKHLKKEARRRRRELRATRARPEPTYREAIKEACVELLPVAYKQARGGFDFAFARQVFYKLRPLILARFGDEREIKSKYITQAIIPWFLREFADDTADWNIIYDARGALWEPHGGEQIPLGLTDIETYLHRTGTDARDDGGGLRFSIDTAGPGDRYGTVLFIEKEGFVPLLRESGLLDEFDIAVMTTKGMSTTAARRFLEKVGPRVKILALHDFDVTGMSIYGTLSRSTDRYEFENPPDVIDLGVRLADVVEHGLPDEYQRQRTDPEKLRRRLRRHGATQEEIAFLMSGKRVELNAFGNDELVDWVRGKLEKHGVAKVVPDDETLVRTFKAAQRHRVLSRRLERLRERVDALPLRERPVNQIRRFVEKYVDENASESWTDAIEAYAKKHGKVAK